MIWAIFKTMALRLIRDKGALTLAFVLPGFIYAIFATIFSSTSGGQLDLRVAMAVTNNTPSAIQLQQTLLEQKQFSISYKPDWSLQDILIRVNEGTDDVGLVLRDGQEQAPILIISEPSRKIAANALTGQLSEILSAQTQASSPKSIKVISTSQNEAVTAQKASTLYYIGATSILFLLFSAMQGAALSLDERTTGITDRLLIGAKGAFGLLFGKFLFLTLQGTVQAMIILAVAQTFFDVAALQHLDLLMLTSILAASLAASIALLIATLCRTAVQMNTISTFVVLLFSAIGGSMVPRFMMPSWMQELGKITPNSWIIEAYYDILARAGHATLQLSVTAMMTAGCLIVTAYLSHRLMRF